jgi:hypothetical protein
MMTLNRGWINLPALSWDESFGYMFIFRIRGMGREGPFESGCAYDGISEGDKRLPL